MEVTPTLDEELDESERIILGECTRSLVRLLGKHLDSRRSTVKVRGSPERRHHQAIVLGGMYLRLLETYPPDEQQIIKDYAQRLAALIGK